MAIEYRSEPEYCEWLDGEAHPKVSPRIRHGAIQAQFVTILKTTAPKPIIATEGDVAVDNDERRRTKLIPDISLFFPERFKGLTYDEQDEPPFSPEIAIEVRSRGDSQSYLERKIARYFATGSKLILDVDFRKRTVVSYTINRSQTFDQTQTFINDVYPWFTFELRELFSVLDALPDWVG